MFLLPNDSKWSGFHVYSPNWKITKAKLFLNWYADCNFKDSQYLNKYIKGKSIRLKRGIVHFKILEERRGALQCFGITVFLFLRRVGNFSFFLLIFYWSSVFLKCYLTATAMCSSGFETLNFK